MYVLARVPKRGAVALMCLLVALLGLVMGMFWTCLLYTSRCV